MENIIDNTPEEIMDPKDRFAIPIRYGLMVGFISMFLTTISFLYILKINFWAFSGFSILMFIIPLIFYFITAKKQRTAMGGFITLKDAFQAIFVVILISSVISSIYGVIYTKYIDPQCLERMKETMLNFFENVAKMPQAEIDKQMEKIDSQITDSLKIGTLLYSIAKSIIISSIFGFIVALIVKKERPAVSM